MTLDRADVALRFAVALATPGDSNVPYSEWNHGEIVRVGFMFADAFAEESARRSFTALTPPVAPKSEAAKYEPVPGDVIRWKWESEAEATYVRVVVGRDRWVGVASGAIHDDMRDEPIGEGAVYLRPATPAEREAAGLPSPEATRPTWVRVTATPKSGWRVTVGRIYKVSRWSEDAPQVLQDDGTSAFLSRPDGKDTDSMGYPAWEPATPPAPVEPCPPPVAASVEGGEASGEVRQALIALTDAAEWVMALLKSDGPSIVPHLLDTDENAGQRLRDVIAKAKALLARTVRS